MMGAVPKISASHSPSPSPTSQVCKSVDPRPSLGQQLGLVPLPQRLCTITVAIQDPVPAGVWRRNSPWKILFSMCKTQADTSEPPSNVSFSSIALCALNSAKLFCSGAFWLCGTGRRALTGGWLELKVSQLSCLNAVVVAARLSHQAGLQHGQEGYWAPARGFCSGSGRSVRVGM